MSVVVALPPVKPGDNNTRAFRRRLRPPSRSTTLNRLRETPALQRTLPWVFVGKKAISMSCAHCRPGAAHRSRPAAPRGCIPLKPAKNYV